MKLRRVLCPIDFSDTSQAGLAPATSITTQYGGELVLLHVLNFPFAQIEALPPGFDVEAYYESMADEAREQMEKLVDPDATGFMQVTAQVERGVPYAEIARVCQEDDIDLLVIPTHARTGISRLLLGSTAEKVVRMTECPVLAVHPGDDPAFNPETIVYATDFSESASQALAYAVDLARRYEARLVMLHVVTLWEYDPGNPSWRFPPLPEEYQSSIVEGAQNQLESCRKAAAESSIEAETMLVRGFDAAAEIVRVATDELDADLLVMGTHGHTGITHALLGSVANKVMRTFHGPVLTVRQTD